MMNIEIIAVADRKVEVEVRNQPRNRVALFIRKDAGAVAATLSQSLYASGAQVRREFNVRSWALVNRNIFNQLVEAAK